MKLRIALPSQPRLISWKISRYFQSVAPAARMLDRSTYEKATSRIAAAGAGLDFNHYDLWLGKVRGLTGALPFICPSVHCSPIVIASPGNFLVVDFPTPHHSSSCSPPLTSVLTCGECLHIINLAQTVNVEKGKEAIIIEMQEPITLAFVCRFVLNLRLPEYDPDNPNDDDPGDDPGEPEDETDDYTNYKPEDGDHEDDSGDYPIEPEDDPDDWRDDWRDDGPDNDPDDDPDELDDEPDD